MAILRLFANLRESAGTNRVEIDAETVGELLSEANSLFGERFTSGAAIARVWVNGEHADESTELTHTDEVALIPPVSGGSGTSSIIGAGANLQSVALIISLLAVAWAEEMWFVFVAVGAILAWILDLSESSKRLSEPFVVYPPLIGATIGAVGTYALGFNGFASGLALATIIAVSWPVFDRSRRDLRSIAATILITAVATGASSGLVLIRLTGTITVTTFVFITVIALIGAWFAGSYGAAIQSIDANVGALLGALVAGLLSGLILVDIEIGAGLLGGLAVAAGVIAGRGFGSIMRTGAVSHTEDPPGALALFDGAAVAALLFWITLWIFS